MRSRIPLVLGSHGGAASSLPPHCNVDTMQKSVCMADKEDCFFSMADAKGKFTVNLVLRGKGRVQR